MHNIQFTMHNAQCTIKESAVADGCPFGHHKKSIYYIAAGDTFIVHCAL